MTIFRYATGEWLREATELEIAWYQRMTIWDSTGTGAFPGKECGYDFTIYMI